MNEATTTLTARRERLLVWGKGLLLAALVVFLSTIASGVEGTPGTLLSGRASYLAFVLNIPADGYRYIWGGPATLEGLQFATYSLSGLGAARIIWMRLRHGRWSRLGFALWLCPPVIGLTALSDISRMAYPATLDEAATDKLLAVVEQREPGLIARLSQGKRPGGADTRSRSVSIDRFGTHRQDGVPIETILLKERGTIDGLRFALAQRALARSDRAALLRLLPLELPRREIDMPARNAFARRLEKMELLAGGPVVAESDRPELRRRIADWRWPLEISGMLRPAMQLVFVIGLMLSLFGWILGVRLKRLRRFHTMLSAETPVGSPKGRSSSRPGSWPKSPS